jgi:CPA2 family monovalent cation:H+ antiporter-2
VESLSVGLNLLIVLATAVAGGMAAKRLHFPVILGYLAGGILVGPFGFGLVHDNATIDTLANIGVVLMLFAIGLEFSLNELLRFGKVAVFGGIAQILLTATVGFGLGRLVGMGNTGAVFFGLIISLSSTMVVLKLLLDRGEIDTTHGRVLLGILLVQDLSVVPIMVIMPAMGDPAGALWASLGMAFMKAAGFIALMLVFSYWGMPWLLKRVAGQRSRELFLLTVIVLCLAAAFGTYYFGLSAAFGAFAAGLLISQSPFARQAFADILPLRDTFAALFFVSLGMLADRHYILSNASIIAVVVAVIILVKLIITSGIIRLFGYSQKTVLFVGTGLINVGEFGFIIALIGLKVNIFTGDMYNLIIASAIITMFVTPFAMTISSFGYAKLSQSKRFSKQMTSRLEPGGYLHSVQLSRHAVICGYGQVGRRIAEVLEKQKLAYLVIELDPNVVTNLRRRGVLCIYGDASNPEILAHADLDKARILICTTPDYVATKLTAQNAKKINPKLDIVARVHHDRDVESLKDIGVTELVLPFFEGSLEMIRHTLHKFGMSGTDIQYILNKMRQEQTEGKKEG